MPDALHPPAVPIATAVERVRMGGPGTVAPGPAGHLRAEPVAVTQANVPQAPVVQRVAQPGQGRLGQAGLGRVRRLVPRRRRPDQPEVQVAHGRTVVAAPGNLARAGGLRVVRNVAVEKGHRRLASTASVVMTLERVLEVAVTGGVLQLVQYVVFQSRWTGLGSLPMTPIPGQWSSGSTRAQFARRR